MTRVKTTSSHIKLLQHAVARWQQNKTLNDYRVNAFLFAEVKSCIVDTSNVSVHLWVAWQGLLRWEVLVTTEADSLNSKKLGHSVRLRFSNDNFGTFSLFKIAINSVACDFRSCNTAEKKSFYLVKFWRSYIDFKTSSIRYVRALNCLKNRPLVLWRTAETMRYNLASQIV